MNSYYRVLIFSITALLIFYFRVLDFAFQKDELIWEFSWKNDKSPQVAFLLKFGASPTNKIKGWNAIENSIYSDSDKNFSILLDAVGEQVRGKYIVLGCREGGERVQRMLSDECSKRNKVD